jgi:solute carrier family 25 phosphate transporter 3
LNHDHWHALNYHPRGLSTHSIKQQHQQTLFSLIFLTFPYPLSSPLLSSQKNHLIIMSLYPSFLTAPRPIATSEAKVYDTMYFTKGAASGGICCSLTHGGMTPVDVVKTRIQLDPAKYNTGLVGGFKTIIAEEGSGALLTGLGATAGGYFIQGWFKFGGVEFFKVQAVAALGEEKAWESKTGIYLAAAGAAEFIADIFLCPLEAVRIRSVSDPKFATGLADGFGKIMKNEGVGGFYAGFGPILFKQVPYTMAKFAVQGAAQDSIYEQLGTDVTTVSPSYALGVSLGSGVIAGVAAAIISHPADTLLSMVNKAGAGGNGGTVSRLTNIAKEVGFYKLCTNGLLPRCVMIGTLTAGQFGIFDIVMGALGAEKFHFHDPSSAAH